MIKKLEEYFAEQIVSNLRILKRKDGDEKSVVFSFQPIVIPESMLPEGEEAYQKAREKVLRIFYEIIETTEATDWESFVSGVKEELRKRVESSYRR